MYAEKLLRGIPNEAQIDPDGSPSSSLFYFEKKDPSQRSDGNNEISINWYDSNKALRILLKQKKGDEVQFKAGAAILLKKEVDRIKKSNYVNKRLSYERQPLPENRHHGNLLLKDTASKQLMKKIAASIALSVVDIKKKDECDRNILKISVSVFLSFFKELWGADKK